MLLNTDNLSDAQMNELMVFYNETTKFEATIGIVIPLIFAFVIVIGLVGNLLVVIVALNRQMINSTNTLIIGKDQYAYYSSYLL